MCRKVLPLEGTRNISYIYIYMYVSSVGVQPCQCGVGHLACSSPNPRGGQVESLWDASSEAFLPGLVGTSPGRPPMPQMFNVE